MKEQMFNAYERIFNNLANAIYNLDIAESKLDCSLSINDRGYNANNISNISSTLADIKYDVDKEILPAINRMNG